MAIIRLTVDDETAVTINASQTLQDVMFISTQTVLGVLPCLAGIALQGTRIPASALVSNVGFACGLIAFAFTPMDARLATDGDTLLRPPIPDDDVSAQPQLNEQAGVLLSGEALGFGLKQRSG